MIAMINDIMITIKSVIVLLVNIISVFILMAYLAFMAYIIDPIVKWVSNLHKKICRKNK